MSKEIKKRPIYLEKIKPFIGKEIIKVIMGQRRTGKSYVLYQLIDLLKTEYNVSEEQIIYINKELNEFKDIRNYQDLLDFVESKSNTQTKQYLIIDEVQDIVEFEKALRDLLAKGDIDIYISGSNANLLSSELSTYLAGRYFEIHVFPLSYREFLQFHNKEKGKESFGEYLKYGGLPYLIHLDLEDEIVFDYLKNVYASILLKDIVTRYGIRNVSFLEQLVLYLSDNVGSLVSAKKISDFLKSQRVNISPNVILNYLHYLNSVFFIFEVKRKEIGKRIFAVGSKHYFGDLGLRNSILTFQQNDLGKILENVVYLQLRIWGYRVFVGRDKEREIDFIAEKKGKKVYIQVAYLITDEKTREREFGNLLKIKDNYEKIVVSMDEFLVEDYQGVKHLNIMDFCLDFEN